MKNLCGRVHRLSARRSISHVAGGVTHHLAIDHPSEWPIRESYSVLSNEGELLDEHVREKTHKEDAIKLYKTMVRLSAMDKVFFDAQRQGRISFYMCVDFRLTDRPTN